MEAVVNPLFHRYDTPPPAVSVTEPPEQNDVGPEEVILATGVGFTSTETLAVATQPPDVLTVTV